MGGGVSMEGFYGLLRIIFVVLEFLIVLEIASFVFFFLSSSPCIV